MKKLAQTYGIYSIFDFSCKLSILPSVCKGKQGSNIAAWFEGKFWVITSPLLFWHPQTCVWEEQQWQHQQQRQHRQLQRQQQQPKQKHQRQQQRLRARHVLLKNKSNCCFRSNQVFFSPPIFEQAKYRYFKVRKRNRWYSLSVDFGRSSKKVRFRNSFTLFRFFTDSCHWHSFFNLAVARNWERGPQSDQDSYGCSHKTGKARWPVECHHLSIYFSPSVDSSGKKNLKQK